MIQWWPWVVHERTNYCYGYDGSLVRKWSGYEGFFVSDMVGPGKQGAWG